MKKLTHLASRIFGVPLLIHRPRLEVILSVLGERLNLATPVEAAISSDAKSRKPYAVSNEGIATISICGPLVKRASGDALSGGPTSYAEIEDEFMDAATDPSIRGILLDVDSPGGEVGGLFDLAAQIYGARTMKPIYGVANEEAFSAAYALLSACERVYMSETAGVGSVGVIACHVDQSGYDEQAGLKFNYIFAGAKKADFNPHEPLSEDARGELQAEVDRLYGMFVSAVAKHRGIDAKVVRATEAGLLFGQAGVDAGFADKIGTMRDTLNDITAAVHTRRTGTTSSYAASAAAEITQKENEAMDPNAKLQADAEQTAAAPMDPTKDPEDMNDPECKDKAKGAAAPVPVPAAAAPVAASLEKVLELCAVAGKDAAFAMDLAKRALPESEVSKLLLSELAKAQAGPVRSTVSPATGGITNIESVAAEAARASGKTKEQAYVEVLKQNPSAYTQYLGERRMAAASVKQ